MNNVDYIYLKLCLKYGFNNIAYKKDIIKQYETNIKDNIYEIDNSNLQKTPVYLISNQIYFINTKTNKKIDLQEEMNNGTFNEKSDE